MQKCLSILILAFCVIQLMATQPVYRHITSGEGLACNTIYYTFQDRDKYIWFATESGVTRFDGHEYQTFFKQDGLSDNEVYQIFQDRKGRIWFNTRNGLPSYYYEGLFYNAENDSLLCKINPGCFLYGFYEDSIGNIWIGSDCNGIYKIDPKGQVQNFIVTGDGMKVFFINEVESQIYVVSREGLHRVNEATNRIEFLGEKAFETASPRAIFLDGKYYVIIDKSLYCLQQNGKKEWQIPLFENNELIHISKKSPTELWLGTRKGYFKFDLLNKTLGKAYLANEAISSIYPDHEGAWWITTLDNGIFYTGSHQIVNYTSRDGFPSAEVQSVFQSKEGIIAGFDDATYVTITAEPTPPTKLTFTGFRNRIRNFDFYGNEVFINAESVITRIKGSDTSFFQLHARDLHLDTTGLTICTSKGVEFIGWQALMHFESNSPDPSKSIQDTVPLTDLLNCNCNVIKKHKTGQLLIGTDDGLVLLKGNQSIHHLKGNRIADITTAFDGIWMSTLGNGLFYFADKDSLHFTESNEGFAFCKKLYAEEDQLWVATNSGLLKIEKGESDFNLIKYNRDGILPSNKVNDILRDRNGILWIATEEGLMKIPNDSLFQMATPSPVIIDWVKINGILYPDFDYLNLSHHQNNLQIRFRSPTYRYKPLMEYRIKGRDDGWKQTASNIIELEELSPGSYFIEIRARTIDHPLTFSPATIKAIIHPPVWRTWWFRLLMVFSFIMIIYLFFRIKVLTYNRDIVREILLNISGKLKRQPKVILKVIDGSHVPLREEEILWVKASNVYVEVSASGERNYIMRAKFHEVQTLLKKFKSIKQVHRSYLANLNKIESVNPDMNHIALKGHQIPVSKTYRHLLKDFKGRSKMEF